MKKIIAISGTYGCGKSSLAYSLCSFLKKQGKNVVVLNELARECPFDINQEAGDQTQVWLSCKQVTKELEYLYGHGYEYVIADRSVLDSYCYGLSLNSTNHIFNELQNYLAAHIKKYYYKLYLLEPRAFNFNIEDGVRDTDENFRLTVHENLQKTFDEVGIEYKLIFDDVSVFLEFL